MQTVGYFHARLAFQSSIATSYQGITGFPLAILTNLTLCTTLVVKLFFSLFTVGNAYV
jgi:hypothetical protein